MTIIDTNGLPMSAASFRLACWIPRDERSRRRGRHVEHVTSSDGVKAAVYGRGALKRVVFIRGASTSCGPWASLPCGIPMDQMRSK